MMPPIKRIIKLDAERAGEKENIFQIWYFILEIR